MRTITPAYGIRIDSDLPDKVGHVVPGAEGARLHTGPPYHVLRGDRPPAG